MKSINECGLKRSIHFEDLHAMGDNVQPSPRKWALRRSDPDMQTPVQDQGVHTLTELETSPATTALEAFLRLGFDTPPLPLNSDDSQCPAQRSANKPCLEEEGTDSFTFTASDANFRFKM
jgi:hypothetical protein